MMIFVKTEDGSLVNIAHVVRMLPEEKGTKLMMGNGREVLSPLSLTEIARGHSQIFVVSN